jgi:tRNA 2-selenouridine synthase
VINLPLDDDERQRVGTCYKQQGQQAAIVLGHELVSGAIKAERIEPGRGLPRPIPTVTCTAFAAGCARRSCSNGSRRSRHRLPRVGGYKAMRTFLLDTVEHATAQCDFVLLGGMTGTGKTEVLGQLRNALDLEGHANHRGSSFGKRATAQPSTIDFENRLAVDLLKSARRASSSSCWRMKAA